MAGGFSLFFSLSYPHKNSSRPCLGGRFFSLIGSSSCLGFSLVLFCGEGLGRVYPCVVFLGSFHVLDYNISCVVFGLCSLYVPVLVIGYIRIGGGRGYSHSYFPPWCGYLTPPLLVLSLDSPFMGFVFR